MAKTYLGNGAHKITSVDNGLALTAPTSNGGNVSLSQYTGNDRQKWSISKCSNGYYRISPMSNSSYNISASGTAVQMQSPQTGNNNDEWILYKYTGTPTFELQQQSKWCWAACAWMLSSAHITPEVSHETLAIYVKSNSTTWDTTPSDDLMETYNRTGGIDCIVDILEKIFGEVNLYANDKGVIEKNVLRQILDSDVPVIVSIFDWNHYALIYDYHMQGETMMLHIFDPFKFDEFEINENVDHSPYENENYQIIDYDIFEAAETIGWNGYITFNIT